MIAQRPPSNCRRIHIINEVLPENHNLLHAEPFIRTLPKDYVIQCDKKILKRTALKREQACDPEIGGQVCTEVGIRNP